MLLLLLLFSYIIIIINNIITITGSNQRLKENAAGEVLVKPLISLVDKSNK